MAPLWHVETHCQLNILMKNNKGYYSWIHSLNEAAVQSQIFQQQLDEEKAKKKAGGMPGFFSSGPATPAKRKEETGEPTVPAHMATTSRLGDKVQSEPRTEPVSKPETTAKKLPARSVEASKTTSTGWSGAPRKRVSDEKKTNFNLNDPENWGMESMILTTPENMELTRKMNTADAVAVANARDQESSDFQKGENFKPGFGRTAQRAASLSRAMQTGGKRGENLSAEEATQQAIDVIKKRQEGIRTEFKKSEDTGEITPVEVPSSAEHWDTELYTEFPDFAPPPPAPEPTERQRKLYAKFPTLSPEHYDLAPPTEDLDNDGDVGDTGDVLARVIEREDQSTWGRKITNPETGEREYISTSQFGTLGAEDRSPQSWEKAFKGERIRDIADRIKSNKKRKAEAASFSPNFTSPVGAQARIEMGAAVEGDEALASQKFATPRPTSSVASQIEADRAAFEAEAKQTAEEQRKQRTAKLSGKAREKAEAIQTAFKETEASRATERQRREGETGELEDFVSGVAMASGAEPIPSTVLVPKGGADNRPGIKTSRTAKVDKALAKKIAAERAIAANTVQESIANIVNKMLLG